LAWHHAQVGNILLKMGDVDSASREFARVDSVFPGHPDARDGRERARLSAALSPAQRPE
jgi:hypothetical protein